MDDNEILDRSNIELTRQLDETRILLGNYRETLMQIEATTYEATTRERCRKVLAGAMSQTYGQHHIYETDDGKVYIEQVEPPNWVAMPRDDFLAMVRDFTVADQEQERTARQRASGPTGGYGGAASYHSDQEQER